MVGIVMPARPSPLGGGYGAMKLQQADLSFKFNDIMESMGNSSFAKTPVGQAFMSYLNKLPNMFNKFSASVAPGQTGGNNLFGGIMTNLDNILPDVRQELSQFTNVFLPASVAKSIGDAVVTATDNSSQSPPQQYKPRQRTPVPGMNGPGSGPTGPTTAS